MNLGSKDPVSQQRRQTMWQAAAVTVIVLIAAFLIFRALTME